jgi:hypothetical protein
MSFKNTLELSKLWRILVLKKRDRNLAWYPAHRRGPRRTWSREGAFQFPGVGEGLGGGRFLIHQTQGLLHFGPGDR